MSVPTKGETYSQLIEYLRKAQEACSIMSHLTIDEDELHARGWRGFAEMLKEVNHNVIQLATRRMR